MSEAVKVVVRCRPLNSKETANGNVRIVDMDLQKGIVSLRNPKEPKAAPKEFVFDNNNRERCTQRNIYDEAVYKIVESVLEGYNGTVFAYGQTGTGKSHTMTGDPHNPQLRGVIPNAFEHIFDFISTEAPGSDTTHLVRASFLEIYNEEIRDLLAGNKQKLDLKEDKDKGVFVKDLSMFVVTGISEMEKYMDIGNSNRAVAGTAMNAQSSRSHSIFTITIESSGIGPSGDQQIRVGKLHLVDLAGSERQSKTEATGDRLKEAAKINLSLSALGNVISALVDEPELLRDSKLTRLLQDSLGGNAKTVMIANMGPADYNYDESISTLRYASRAKNIKNKPKINEDPKDAMIRQYQEEIAKLKAAILAQGGSLDVQTQKDIQGIATNITQDQMMNNASASAIDPELLNKIKAEKEEEIMRILGEKGVVEEERKKIASKLAAISEKQRQQKEEKLELIRRLEAMQEKLLQGGVNLLDENEKQQQKLRLQAQQLEQAAIEEKKLKRKLAQRESEFGATEEQYANLNDEIASKTKKLKKLWSKLQYAKTDIEDIQSEWQNEKAELLDTIRELSKQLKMKMLVINSFVPPEEMVRIESRATWDEESSDWKIQGIQLAGNNLLKKSDGMIDLAEAEESGHSNEKVYQSSTMPGVYFSYSKKDSPNGTPNTRAKNASNNSSPAPSRPETRTSTTRRSSRS